MGISGAGVLVRHRLERNFHEVESQRFYRSAQRGAADLANVWQHYHIRTVINLRGAALGSDWYHQELAACRMAGAAHVDIGMSATEPPTPVAVQQLLQLYRSAAYPLLVHCKSGSDRTGFASALYLMEIDHVPAYEARERGLTWKDGHIPVWHWAENDEFLDYYMQDSAGTDLESWAKLEYPAVYVRECAEDGFTLR